jgi:hypothetical protein
MSTNAFAPLNKRTVRAEVNPLDKCTIVSIFPKEIIERKHTIQPGVFHIPAGSKKNPGIAVVGPSSWWKEIHPDEPLLEMINSSIQVADSVVKDWANGLICCDMNDRMPGIFFVPGEFGAEVVKQKFANLIELYDAKQKNWFKWPMFFGPELMEIH